VIKFSQAQPLRRRVAIRRAARPLSAKRARERPVLETRLAHSITRSARSSSVGGTLRPNAFAVLRLIANSNLVAA
jgi:hypothetical protein